MDSTNTAPAVIFDLDGTIIDTAPGLAATMNALLKRRGRREMDPDILRPHVSHGAKVIIAHAMAATGEPADEALIDVMFDEFISHYVKTMADASTPYPGLARNLARLSEDGYRLGICTNRIERSARILLGALKLDVHFGAITGQDSFNAAKPDPRPVLETLKLLNSPAAASVFVGDSEVDIAAARAAGLPVIVTSFGYAQGPEALTSADGVLSHFDELPALVSRLAG